MKRTPDTPRSGRPSQGARRGSGDPPHRGTATLVLGLAFAAAMLLLFGWLATDVAFGHTIAFDAWGRELVHRHATPAFTETMRFVSLAGTPGFLLPAGIVIFAWLLAKGHKRAGWLFAASGIGGFVLDMTLKLAFGRHRPQPYFGTPLPETYSFPSGHAIFSVCFFGVLAMLAARGAATGLLRYLILALGAVVAILIGLSRVYLGVHYPSDVLGGYAAASVWVAAVSLADRWLETRRVGRVP